MFWTPLVRRERCLTRWPCLLMPQGSFIVHTVLTLLRMVMQIIYVNDDFNVEEAEGSHLTDDLVVGKQIAGGAQVCGLWRAKLLHGCLVMLLVYMYVVRRSPLLLCRALSICCLTPMARTAGSCLKR